MLLLATALLAGVAGGSCDLVSPSTPQPVRLTLAPAPSVLEVGATLQLVATVENSSQKSVQWTSSDPAVVSVSAAGVATALSRGQATVTATAMADTACRAAAIITVPPVTLALQPVPAQLLVGQTAQLTATVGSAADAAVEWRSSEPAVVSVAADGTLSALGAGSAVVTAHARADTSVSASATIAVPPVTLALSAGVPELLLGQSRTLHATVANAVDTAVIWRSARPAVAAVSAAGTVTALGSGTVTISALACADTARRDSIVLTVPQVGITLTPTRADLQLGATQQLAATITKAVDTGVLWRSSAPAVASVSDSGLVTALSAGSATITALARADSSVRAGAEIAVALPPGSLTLSITGLPAGVGAAVTVRAPDGSTTPVPQSTTLNGLLPGSYLVSAGDVTGGGASYRASPATQAVSVPSGGTVQATVSYAAVEPALNLTLDAAYLTQVTQSYAGGVPLVAGRAALLRVFVLASRENTLRPAVRVRLYSGSALIATDTLAAPAAGVPTVASEGSLLSSWNLALPASQVQPGLAVLVDVDPANAVAESDETDNRFPRSGTPLPLDVRNVPAFTATLVPIAHTASGKTGQVSAANKDAYLADVMRMYPVSAYDASVHAVYTTSAGALSGTDAWLQILNEIDALRVADGSRRHYYGVLPQVSGAAWCGLGYVPGLAAIGTDACGASTAAHEWGHNLGRQHAPCGNPANPDPAYPYANATLGTWGYDAASGTLLAPSSNRDLMSYCSPAWISDYTYRGLLGYLAASPDAPLAAGSAGTSLLVWGRITPQGTLVLEPAFEIAAPAALPARSGPYTVQGLDAAGRALFSLSFAAQEIGDAPGGGRQFAFAVPVGWAAGRLSRLRLAGPSGAGVEQGGVVGVQATEAAGRLDASIRAQPVGARTTRLRWAADSYGMVLVRDAATGQLLSFARGGDITLAARAAELDLTFSDGVHNLRRRIRPAP